jgi:uncharacterized protein (TIGR00255 family)
MIRSMTGYSRARAEEADFALSVTAKSINHRFLDLQVRLPTGLECFEPLIRRTAKEHISRGHVEVQVNLEKAGPAELRVDRSSLDAYLATIQELRREHGFESEPDLVALLRIPGMVSAANGTIPAEDMDRFEKALENTLARAFTSLNEMRAREGEALERDMRSRLERLDALAGEVERHAQDALRLYGRRLERRVRELLGNVELDGARLAQEVAYLASRADITEELTRFRSHLDQARQLLEESSEAGKKLDFLLQEMNREANTLLSKTTDVPEIGLEISRRGIEMKTEIEKLREQAQNIE